MVDGSSFTPNDGRPCGAWGAAVGTCLCVAVVVAACDESFEPIVPSELALSVFGYLDASADTQWIRIMPIRPLRVSPPDALDATVTLEHVGSGRIIELRDSLFRFSASSDPDLGSEGVYLHNFWTREDIEPGATYRFSARRAGMGAAEAVVEIPRDYDVEVAINQVQQTDELQVTGLKHLPFLTGTIHFHDDCGWGVVGFPDPAEQRSDDPETHRFSISNRGGVARDGCGPAWIARRELRIVGSEAAWPSGGYSQEALGESSRTSNVTTAVGFLGGVLTKTIPYERCAFRSDGAPVPYYCLLRYDRETATMTGTVREPLCFGLLDSVTVQLTELDRDPARIRTVLSDGAGAFVVGALEPGIPHLVWARAPQVPIDSVFDLARFQWTYTEWEDIHTIHSDTLTFLPGQPLEYEIMLRRLTACDEPHLPRQ